MNGLKKNSIPWRREARIPFYISDRTKRELKEAGRVLEGQDDKRTCYRVYGA